MKLLALILMFPVVLVTQTIMCLLLVAIVVCTFGLGILFVEDSIGDFFIPMRMWADLARSAS